MFTFLVFYNMGSLLILSGGCLFLLQDTSVFGRVCFSLCVSLCLYGAGTWPYLFSGLLAIYVFSYVRRGAVVQQQTTQQDTTPRETTDARQGIAVCWISLESVNNRWYALTCMEMQIRIMEFLLSPKVTCYIQSHDYSNQERGEDEYEYDYSLYIYISYLLYSNIVSHSLYY